MGEYLLFGITPLHFFLSLHGRMFGNVSVIGRFAWSFMISSKLVLG